MAKDYSEFSKEELINRIHQIESNTKYGLVWEEEITKEVFDKESINSWPTLKEIKAKNLCNDPDLPINILIEGDNYHALNILNYTHLGKIDLIYIDPPYNTGNKDFIYNDVFVDKTDTFRHSKWLSFMNKRLQIAINLLKEDGILAVSIDDNEISQLKMLLDKLFNDNTKIIAVKMSEASGLKMGAVRRSGNIPKYKEYVVFAKKGGIRNLRFDSISKTEWDNEYNLFLNNFTKDDRKIINEISSKDLITDDDLNYLDQNILNKISLVSLTKKITELGIDSKNIEKIKSWKIENAWRIARTAASVSVKNIADEKKKLLKQQIFSVTSVRDGILYLVKSDYSDDSKKPRVQLIFADDNLEYHPGDLWADIKTTGLEAEGGVDFKNGKKPLQLLRRIIYSTFNNDAIVFDFFAGSGTTAEAVLELNQIDNGHRQFIVCNDNKEVLGERIVDKYLYPRIVNAIRGYKKKKGLGGNLKYFKTSFVKKSLNRDEMKFRITQNCTELLCLREGIFEEILSKESYRIFEQNKKYMSIFYSLERDTLEDLKKELDKYSGEKILYCFTLDPLGLNKDDFLDWNDVRLEPIPQKILDIYEDIHEY